MARYDFPTVPGLLNVSATQIKLVQACERKYAYQYVLKMREKQSEAQKFGEAVHLCLELWLSKGIPIPDTLAGGVALQGLHMLPKPGADLLVEGKLSYPMRSVGAQLVGLIDLVNPRLPKNLVITDHKSSAAMSYALSDNKLLQDPQALVYSKWGFYRFGLTHLTVEWLYYGVSKEKDGPRVPIGTDRARGVYHIDGNHDKAWRETKMTEAIARCVEIKSLKIHPEQLKRNTNHCYAYNKPCHCMALCLQPKPGQFFGYDNDVSDTEKETTMTLTDKLQARDIQEGLAAQPVHKDPPPVNPPQDDDLQTRLQAALSVRAGEPNKSTEAVAEELASEVQGPVVDTGPQTDQQRARAEAKELKAAEAQEKQEIMAELAQEKMQKEAVEFIAEQQGVPVPVPPPVDALIGNDLAGWSRAIEAQSFVAAPEPNTTDVLNVQTLELGSFVVLVDCLPAKGPAPEPLVSLVAPQAHEIAQQNKAMRWGLVDQGRMILAALCDRAWHQNKPVGLYHADSSTAEYQAVLAVILQHADFVLMGTR